MIIHSNYLKQCKDTQGGIKEFYLAPYQKWTKSEITLSDAALNLIPENYFYDVVLGSIPSTYFYKFECNGTYNQDSSSENGAVFFNHTVEMQVLSTEYYKPFSTLNFTKQYYRVIAKTNNDQFIIFGLYNGLEAKMTNASGGSKAEFNGFNISFSGKEKDTGYLIENLEDAGILLVDSDLFNYSLNLTL